MADLPGSKRNRNVEYFRADPRELLSLFGMLTRAAAHAYVNSIRADYTSAEHDRYSGIWMETRIEAFAVMDTISLMLEPVSDQPYLAYTSDESSHNLAPLRYIP